jgi:glycosyltransferase involved in cell wall biosynthesis
LEWKREKWGFIGKNYFKLSERISILVCKNLISDSKVIHNYYKLKYKADSTIIAYGADIPVQYPADNVTRVHNELGVAKHKYILQITRFEPENNPLLTLRAFKLLKADFKCVLVGGAQNRTNYLEQIEQEKRNDERIVLPGFIYNKEKLEIIWQNAFCYVHGNSVGGTNPALLQAMAAGRPVVALDCIFNRETLDNKGFFFKRDPQNLFERLKYIIDHEKEADELAGKALERIKTVYNWELISDQYEEMFLALTKR